MDLATYINIILDSQYGDSRVLDLCVDAINHQFTIDYNDEMIVVDSSIFDIVPSSYIYRAYYIAFNKFSVNEILRCRLIDIFVQYDYKRLQPDEYIKLLKIYFDKVGDRFYGVVAGELPFGYTESKMWAYRFGSNFLKIARSIGFNFYKLYQMYNDILGFDDNIISNFDIENPLNMFHDEFIGIDDKRSGMDGIIYKLQYSYMYAVARDYVRV